MVILGVSHPISMNNAACVLVDGHLVAFAEEERFLRLKHAPHLFAEKAIEYCLSAAGVTPAQVDVTAIGFSAPTKDGLLQEDVEGYLKGSLSPEQNFRFVLNLSLLDRDVRISSFGRRLYFDHHFCHVASAAIPSGFPAANFISLDGWGGPKAGLIGFWNGSDIDVYFEIPVANSWGLLFELVTTYLGFRPHSGEGKTMGLGAYGKVSPEVLPDWCDSEFGLPDTQRYFAHFAENVVRRDRAEPLLDRHRDLAATLQFYLERSLLKIAAILRLRSGSSRFVLAGGVALNCSANGHLAAQDWVDDLFVQPASHDAGTALGAAILADRQLTGSWPCAGFEHAYWGPSFSDDQIRAALIAAKLPFREVDPAAAICTALCDNEIVGLFQGRAEVGPRALGNRSILANPQHVGNVQRVNQIKGREFWRPLAPAVLEERYTELFDSRLPSRFMLCASPVREAWRRRIPAVVHVDGSARPQSVVAATNPIFDATIRRFQKSSGCPAVLNTSFNLEDEPIVSTPGNAISSFYRSGLDVLVIGNFLLRK
jgi:carbamoyltransferase